MDSAVIILAAGQGSRMESDLPKVLHRLGGVPLVAHAMPSGPVEDDAFEAMARAILGSVEQGCDGILLDLHGAMVTRSHDDGEGELLVRVRAAVRACTSARVASRSTSVGVGPVSRVAGSRSRTRRRWGRTSSEGNTMAGASAAPPGVRSASSATGPE